MNFLKSETFFNLFEAFVKLEFCCIQIIFVVKVLVHKICKFEIKKWLPHNKIEANFVTSSDQKSLHKHIYDGIFLWKYLTAKSHKKHFTKKTLRKNISSLMFDRGLINTTVKRNRSLYTSAFRFWGHQIWAPKLKWVSEPKINSKWHVTFVVRTQNQHKITLLSFKDWVKSMTKL